MRCMLMNTNRTAYTGLKNPMLNLLFLAPAAATARRSLLYYWAFRTLMMLAPLYRYVGWTSFRCWKNFDCRSPPSASLMKLLSLLAQSLLELSRWSGHSFRCELLLDLAVGDHFPITIFALSHSRQWTVRISRGPGIRVPRAAGSHLDPRGEKHCSQKQEEERTFNED